MNALAPLDTHARHRLLALMGIDVYTRRAPAHARTAPAIPAVAQPVAVPSPGRLHIACDPAEAGSKPLSGRYGALLTHILAAIGVAPSDVRVVEPGAGVPVPCIRFHESAAGDALQAPPLAQLRESADAKRALWRGLRPLRRTLGQA